jgi:tetratricopeptide (TPR) repeat protein
MKNLILASIFSCFLAFSVMANEIPRLIQQGDSLYKSFDNKGALDAYLQVIAIDSNHYEANWKTARAYVDIGETIEDDDERADFYQKGHLYARKAAEIQPESSMGHLYLSIALGRVALDAGAKERIQLSKEIKKETDLAIKYDPENATAYHVLGRWNRKLANLSWIEEGFANMFLGGVPEDASNENAVTAFLKAIELEPEHINHHLELGITYEMMGLEDKAREQYQICLELPKSDSDDDKYKAEAKERLEDLN